MKIVCIGSSSVEGIGDSKGIGWVGRLNKLLNDRATNTNEYRIFNLGLKGDSIKQTHKRYLTEALVRYPQLVLIFTGTNDVRWDEQNGNLNQFNPNYMQDWESFIKDLQNANYKVVVLGPTKVDESKGPMVINDTWEIFFKNKDIALFNTQLKELCHKNNIDFLELFNVFDDYDLSQVSFDSVHPNDKGYAILTNYILSNLQDRNLI